MAGKLEKIASTTLSASSSTFTMDSVFSNTYDVYYVTFTNFTGTNGSSGSAVADLRFLDSTGTVISATEYEYAFIEIRNSAGFDNFVSTSATSIHRVFRCFQTEKIAVGSFYIYNPYNSSSYTYINYESAGVLSADTFNANYKGVGIHTSNETIRGFQILETSSGDFESGTINVYGLGA